MVSALKAVYHKPHTEKDVCIMSVTKIVITGGPCAGKSTALARIRQEFTEKGYTVLVALETATELILGGISPSTLESRVEFQRYQLLLQLEKEKIYDRAARFLRTDKVLVVFDRGLFDGRAYVDEPDFEALLKEAGATEQELLAHYDAVFHLVTAAKGAEAFYTTSNNEARSETIEEAAAIDDRTVEAWKNHPCCVIIDNSTGFDEKIRRLIAAIEAILDSI